jgi:YHS domain-containing protein
MNVNDHGIFLDGYDVVAYFTANAAASGSPQHSAKHKGATFYFSSDANKQAFEANPSQYMPKYGGSCAFAVANGKGGVKANPKAFKLYNGELLMFFDDLYEGKRFNTSVPWNADERALYTKAEANWPQLSK